MFSRIFNLRAKNITLSALILGISYFISAVLGLVRDRMLAGHFGAGTELDVYFAAFRIPDFVYNIFILGGLTIAFIPLFSEYLSKNKEEAWKMVNYVLNAFLCFLVFASLILFILSPLLIKWLFPGFGPAEQKLAVPLVRLLFLSPIIFGISNLFSGILQYFNRFFVYSLSPIFYNLGIIFGILFLTPHFGIFGVGLGVILGAFLHMMVQIPTAIKCGFSYRFFLNFKYPAIIRILKLMVPRVFGIAAQQINLIVITAIASVISAGSIAIFNFSNNLQSLPTGVIGVSFAVAIFPALSKTWVQNQKEEFFRNFSLAFRQILLFIIPISLLIFLLRNQIINIILKTGQFGVPEAKLTAACLGIFAFSIFAQSLIPLLSRGFFSLQDTKTPTLITALSVVLNIAFAFFFIWLLSFQNLFTNFIKNFFEIEGTKNIAIIGLPFAFSISAIFQFILLFLLFKRKTKSISPSATNKILT